MTSLAAPPAVVEEQPVESGVALAPVMTIEQARRRLTEIQQFVREAMVQDLDYGVIPGTKKPTLYKPGAEKLAEFYGLAPTIQVTNRIERWDEPGFFHYEVICRLVSKRTGAVVAEGVGSCNSREARYRWRWVWERDLPPNVDKRSLPTKRTRTGTMYRIENDDVFSLPNTILKMAKKRALVDAVLSATRSSALFTQDVEDVGISPDDEPVTPAQEAQAPVERPASPAGGLRPKGVRSAGSGTGNGGSINWSAFWRLARQELGLSQDEVHEAAAALYGHAVSSLTEVIHTQADLDRFASYLQGKPVDSAPADNA